MRLLSTLSFLARLVSQAREILRALVRPTRSLSSVRGRLISQPRVVTQVIARLLRVLHGRRGSWCQLRRPIKIGARGRSDFVRGRIYKNLNCVLLHVYHKGVKVLRRCGNEPISD
jgi:hypothetical protein